jgi:hypothetical protein
MMHLAILLNFGDRKWKLKTLRPLIGARNLFKIRVKVTQGLRMTGNKDLMET